MNATMPAPSDHPVPIFRRIGAIVLLLAATAANPQTLRAHSSHDHDSHSDDGRGQRIWRNVAGVTMMEASFLLKNKDDVRLQQRDGSLVSVPYAALCPTDQAWIENRLATIRSANGDGALREESPADPHRQRQYHAVAGLFVVTLTGAMILCRRRPTGKYAFMIPLALISAAGLGFAAAGPDAAPEIVRHFAPFHGSLHLQYDDDFLYVGSHGLPDHPMMTGIRSWQQQVPLPQPYTGDNAWRIPLHPLLAEKPISAKSALFRGAIALAVNGVPIFNALNNRGDDTYLAGELDEYGGHCGRGDDYHYHTAPVHLETVVGKGNPIGYGLDGFPLYGYTDASGKEPRDLDEFNGRTEDSGYRYYSTKTFPYINGGMRGVVNVVGDQVDPQPRANPIRPAGRPLRDAKITGFTRENDETEDRTRYTLTYDLNGAAHTVRYQKNDEGLYAFTFTDGNGAAVTETYGRRSRPDEKPAERKNDVRKDNRKDVREDVAPQTGPFRVSSPAFEHGGDFPAEFTGDGAGVSPPLAWSGAPAGTKSYAISLWHAPKPGETKSYWVLYNIPANVASLPKDVQGVGQAGCNDKNNADYDPMKSKGPGRKRYNITVYALSKELAFPSAKVTRNDLLAAVQAEGVTLAESTLVYDYERIFREGNLFPPGRWFDIPVAYWLLGATAVIAIVIGPFLRMRRKRRSPPAQNPA